MSDPNQNLGGSPLTDSSLESDEKALHKGRGRMIAGMILAVVAAVGALVFAMGSGDDEAYRKFGRSVNGLDQKDFQGFWGCALQGQDLKALKSDQDLREQINRRAGNGPARYAAYARDKCLPKLTDLEHKLHELIPPEDMQPPTGKLVDAVHRLRGAWSDYIGYLAGLGAGPYEPDAASDQMDHIARAWYDYRRTLSDVNKALRKKIHP